MKKIAFMFPGQGSQSVGMGKDIWEKDDDVKSLFAEADSVLGFSLSKMCFEGPEEELRKTFNTQPTILTVSIALQKLLEKKGIKPAMVLGHSLGEYSALVAAGTLSFSDAVRIVRRRGEFMQEAVPIGLGAMAAILGLDAEKIKNVCLKLTEESKDEIVQAVNFNCPGQVVIAGNTKAVESAIAKCKEEGARKAVLLPVSAPFHSTLMQTASEKLALELAGVRMYDAKIPVVSNVTGQCMESASDIKDLLIKQAKSPVLWEQCMKYVIEEGIDTCIEVGPGKVLSGFLKKINKEIACFNVEDFASLEKTLTLLQGEE